MIPISIRRRNLAAVGHLETDDDKPAAPAKKTLPAIPSKTAMRKLGADQVRRLAKRHGVEYTNKADTIAALAAL